MGGWTIEPFNGYFDHWILPKYLLSKFITMPTDSNRTIEKYKFPIIDDKKILCYHMPLWFHYGPIKVGIDFKKNLTSSIEMFVNSFKKDKKIMCNNKEIWGKFDIDSLNLIKNNFNKNKAYYYACSILAYNKKHIKEQKHQKQRIFN